MSRTKALITGPGSTAIPIFKPGVTQVVGAASASATLSAAMGSGTKAVRIAATKDTWLAFGSAASAVQATSGSLFHPAGWVESYLVDPTDKVSARADAAVGFVTVTELGTI